MACCIFTAYVMNRLIKACEVLNVDLKIQYNVDDGPDLERKGNNSNGQSLVAATLSIEGMTCDGCTVAVDAAIRGLEGVEAISVSLPLARASVVHNPSVITGADLVVAVESKGYGARLGERTAKENLDLARSVEELARLRRSFTNVTTLASLLATIDWFSGWLPVTSALDLQKTACFFSFSIAAWIQLFEAHWIHMSAWQKGVFASPTMDTLISLSLLLGMALSSLNAVLSSFQAANAYMSSGAFLVVVITGGRYLDTLLRRQTSNSLAELFSLQAETSLVRLRQRKSSIDNGQTKEQATYIDAPALALQPGDEILLAPGSVIPCDCYIVSGTGLVDEATMTGEAFPAKKSIGDFLISGTSNLASEFVAVVLKPPGDSALDHLISTVSTATNKNEVEGSSAILSSAFVHIIISIAFLGAFITYALANENLTWYTKLDNAGQRAMAILASACPCALGLAAPSALMSGMSVAWTRGILIRGGSNTIDRLQRLTHIVLDKTGTLTTGQLSVDRVDGQLNTDHCLLIAAAERDEALAHPVAKSIFHWSLRQLDQEQRTEQHLTAVTGTESHPGRGISCVVKLPDKSPSQIHIGNSRLFRENRIDHPFAEDAAVEKDILVHFAVDRKYVATFRVHDTIRRETPMLIDRLRREFGFQISMLTGDTQHEAGRVSERLGIPVLSAKALPHEKGAYIQDLQSKQQGVAMIGDGVNDMPAMSLADVGILLSPGLTRSKAQLQVADVILTTPDLARFADLIVLASMTVRQIRWNVRWAIGYNVISVALAVGLLEPFGVRIDAARAGTSMALSSVTVVAWSLWFRRQLNAVGYS
jgi:P-type Cu+ transporter